MAFEVQEASLGDSAKITDTFLAAFSDDFNKTMFPPTPEVRAFLENSFLEIIPENKHQFLLKVTDPANPNVVAAFAKWIHHAGSPAAADASQDRHLDPAPKWPTDSNADLCDLFFGTMEKHHKELMGNRPHYYLEILGVHPSYQGRGLASKLLKWGLSRADEDGIEVYLSSSPDGKPLYDKNGFEQTKYPFSPWPGYKQVNMIRPVQK